MNIMTPEQKDKIYKAQKSMRGDAFKDHRFRPAPLIREKPWVIPNKDQKPESDNQS